MPAWISNLRLAIEWVVNILQLWDVPLSFVFAIALSIAFTVWGAKNMSAAQTKRLADLSWWTTFQLVRSRMPAKKRRQLYGLALLVALTWGCQLYFFYQSHWGLSEEFPADCTIQWGTGVPPGVAWNGNLEVIANGGCFSRYADGYYLTAVALHRFGVVDRDEERITARGARHEIVAGNVPIVIVATPTYIDEVRQGFTQTSYVLLLVPNGVDPEQFFTLRQAKRLGAKIVSIRGGPP